MVMFLSHMSNEVSFNILMIITRLSSATVYAYMMLSNLSAWDVSKLTNIVFRKYTGFGIDIVLGEFMFLDPTRNCYSRTAIEPIGSTDGIAWSICILIGYWSNSRSFLCILANSKVSFLVYKVIIMTAVNIFGCFYFSNNFYSFFKLSF